MATELKIDIMDAGFRGAMREIGLDLSADTAPGDGVKMVGADEYEVRHQGRVVAVSGARFAELARKYGTHTAPKAQEHTDGEG